MIARFLGVRVWELSRVAVHYQEEARVILQAQYKARAYLEVQRFKSQGDFGTQKKFVPRELPEF
ncbi:MAG: hypothetical protein AABN95_16120 [Acidobacteriota bacterium]